jgi:hypothetical protein
MRLMFFSKFKSKSKLHALNRAEIIYSSIIEIIRHYRQQPKSNYRMIEESAANRDC